MRAKLIQDKSVRASPLVNHIWHRDDVCIGRITSPAEVGSAGQIYSHGKETTIRTILLIEDNLDDEALTLRAFQKNNILNSVTVVRDGAAALDHFSSGDSAAAPLPAIVLLDLNLPKVGGLEVLRRLRSAEWTRFLPVIVLTSSREEEDILASYQAGANAYIRKALRFSDFAEAIRVLGTFWLQLNEMPLRETGYGREPAAR